MNHGVQARSIGIGVVVVVAVVVVLFVSRARIGGVHVASAPVPLSILNLTSGDP